MVPRLPRQHIRIADLFLCAGSIFPDRIEHQHPVIADLIFLRPHRVDSSAPDDRLVYLVVKLLYFMVHNRFLLFNPI